MRHFAAIIGSTALTIILLMLQFKYQTRLTDRALNDVKSDARKRLAQAPINDFYDVEEEASIVQRLDGDLNEIRHLTIKLERILSLVFNLVHAIVMLASTNPVFIVVFVPAIVF